MTCPFPGMDPFIERPPIWADFHDSLITYIREVYRRPDRTECYPVSLRSRLPRVSVPLDPGELDVRLDLQTAFTPTWETGPYPATLFHDRSPPGMLSESDAAWCRERLEAAGIQQSDR